MNKGVLYLYLASGLEVPLATATRERLKGLYPTHHFHDIDLSADSLTWHYTHQWLASMEEVVLVLEGEVGIGGLVDAKKTVAQLLKYRKKLKVRCLKNSLNSLAYPAFKPLERFDYGVLED